MVSKEHSSFVPRDFDPDYGYCDWWYCSTSAFVIKWVIVGVIFAIILLWFVGGYFHAKRRIKKGLPPLAYHRFLVSRRHRARFYPAQVPQNNVAFYDPQTGRYQNQMYPMQPWVAPPPAYGDQGYVPPYPGAPGASKVNPDQNTAGTEANYSAPPGPPPPAAAAHAATSIREINNAQNEGPGRAIFSNFTSGPNHTHQPTVEALK